MMTAKIRVRIKGGTMKASEIIFDFNKNEEYVKNNS
jgi:hypothetical protein